MVNIISFTGSKRVGREILAAASKNFTPVGLELGGKSPNIIFADARIDPSVFQAVFGVFALTGQACVAGSRTYVEENIFDEFVNKFREAANTLKIGKPQEPDTILAPLVSEDQLKKVETMI